MNDQMSYYPVTAYRPDFVFQFLEQNSENKILSKIHYHGEYFQSKSIGQVVYQEHSLDIAHSLDQYSLLVSTTVSLFNINNLQVLTSRYISSSQSLMFVNLIQQWYVTYVKIIKKMKDKQFLATLMF